MYNSLIQTDCRNRLCFALFEGKIPLFTLSPYNYFLVSVVTVSLSVRQPVSQSVFWKKNPQHHCIAGILNIRPDDSIIQDILSFFCLRDCRFSCLKLLLHFLPKISDFEVLAPKYQPFDHVYLIFFIIIFSQRVFFSLIQRSVSTPLSLSTTHTPCTL